MPFRPLPPFVSLLIRMVLTVFLAASAFLQGVIWLTEPEDLYGIDVPQPWGLVMMIASGLMSFGMMFQYLWFVSAGLALAGMWYSSVAINTAFLANAGVESWSLPNGALTLGIGHMILAVAMSPPITSAKPPRGVTEFLGEDDDGNE